MDGTQDTVESNLVDHVNRSRTAYEAAKSDFQRIASQNPVGASNPDSNAALRAAIWNRTRTLTDYYVAVGELVDYLLDRKIPDRLAGKE
jgi:hypothetical protein